MTGVGSLFCGRSLGIPALVASRAESLVDQHKNSHSKTRFGNLALMKKYSLPGVQKANILRRGTISWVA